MAVEGPHLEGVASGHPSWRVIHIMDGKRKSKMFRTESDANDYATELRRKEMSDAPQTDATAPSSTAGSVSTDANKWREIAAKLRDRIYHAVESGQVDLLQAGRVVASLTTAAGKMLDQAEMEETVDRLERQVAEMSRAKRHGIRAKG